jgi:hypothetical protein
LPIDEKTVSTLGKLFNGATESLGTLGNLARVTVPESAAILSQALLNVRRGKVGLLLRSRLEVRDGLVILLKEHQHLRKRE